MYELKQVFGLVGSVQLESYSVVLSKLKALLTMSKLYEQDFYAWTQEQSVLLLQGALTQLDVENLSEEIQSLGRQERRELLNRLVVLLHHLLKWEFQPKHRSRSWIATIKVQRLDIAKLLEQNPSLRPCIPEAIADAYLRAIVEVYGETGITVDNLPVVCPYSLEQILKDQNYEQ